MSVAEPAFKGAGAAPGIEVWRIEKLLPVRVKEAPGKFYQGDSYILLVTTASKRYQPNPNPNRLGTNFKCMAFH